MIKDLLKSKTAQQFIRFVVVGGSAFLIDFSINLLITSSLNLEIKKESAIANVISYTIALIYNYILSSKWSFRSDTRKWNTETAIRFIAVNLFNLAWSSLVIWYLVGVIKNMNILPSESLVQPFTKILVTSFMTLVSFVLYKKLVFKEDR